MSTKQKPAIEATEEQFPAVTIEPKRTRSKPGENKVQVTLSDEDYGNLSNTADGRSVNVWLSRMLAGQVGALASEYSQRK